MNTISENPNPTPRKYLTIKEVCAAFGMSRSTFHRLRRRGDFPPGVIMSPGKIGFITVEIEAWWTGLSRR